MDKVRGIIQSKGLLTRGDRVVVGVSGGPDSIVLLHILKILKEEYALYLHVAHLNHQFRGDDADEDARFVERVAKEWGLDSTIRVVDVPMLSKTEGISPEEAGRQARYSLFSEVAKDFNCRKIAVAHHSDDQAETILLNLIRGTGMAGLTGMKVIREQNIIRPLLYVTRQEIEAYCAENRLESRLDATNLKPDYRRNRIRLQLIPYIEKEFNPNFRQALIRTAEILTDENDYLNNRVEEILNNHLTKQSKRCMIPIRIMQNQPIALQRRIVRKMIVCLRDSTQGIGFEHIEQVIRLGTNPRTGKRIDLPGGLVVFIEYDNLCLRFRKKDTELLLKQRDLSIPGITPVPELDMHFQAHYLEQDLMEEENDNSVVFLNPAEITLPLMIRQRQDGDKMKLPGGIGHSKVKKIMIDMKIPQSDRMKIPLIVDSVGQILWIVEHRKSDYCRRKPYCKGWIRLEMKRNIQGS